MMRLFGASRLPQLVEGRLRLLSFQGLWPPHTRAGDCGRRHQVWGPFLSGDGGITPAMFPNGVVSYCVSDGGAHHWARAIRGADKLRPMC